MLWCVSVLVSWVVDEAELFQVAQVCHSAFCLRVASLTVLNSTEQVGLNPFEEEDDEETQTETPAQQPDSSPVTVVNEEVETKTLVTDSYYQCLAALRLLFFSSPLLLIPLFPSSSLPVLSSSSFHTIFPIFPLSSSHSS